MKSGIMTYCLKNALPESERSMDRLIHLAGEEGWGLEVYSPDLKSGDQDVRKLAESARKLADQCGIKIFSFGTGARVGDVDPDLAESNMKELKEALEIAEILGTSTICPAAIDSQPVQPNAKFGMRFDVALPYIVEQMQELADEGAKRGVSIALVNHCFLVYLGVHQYWISLLAGKPEAGACVDPGNYLFYTYGAEDPVRETKICAKYAKLVRAGDWVVKPDEEIVKDYLAKPKGQGSIFNCTGVVFGEGAVDHKTCFKILDDAGYDGYVSLKVGGTSQGGPLEAIRKSMKNLSAMLAKL